MLVPCVLDTVTRLTQNLHVLLNYKLMQENHREPLPTSSIPVESLRFRMLLIYHVLHICIYCPNSLFLFVFFSLEIFSTSGNNGTHRLG